MSRGTVLLVSSLFILEARPLYSEPIVCRCDGTEIPALALELYVEIRAPSVLKLSPDEKVTRLRELVRELAAYSRVYEASTPEPGVDDRIDGLARRCAMKTLVMAAYQYPPLEEVLKRVSEEAVASSEEGEVAPPQKTPARFIFRHIFFHADADSETPEWERAQTRAEAAYQRLLEGEEFQQVAQDVDESPSPLSAKGRRITKFKGALSAAVEESILSLEPTSFSKPFKSRHGYHLFLLEEVIEPQAAPGSNLREEDREAAARKIRSRENAEWMKRAEGLFVEQRFRLLGERGIPETEAVIRCGPYVYSVGDFFRSVEWDIRDYETYKRTQLQVSRDHWLFSVICRDYRIAAKAYEEGWLSKPEIRAAIQARKRFSIPRYILYRHVRKSLDPPTKEEVLAYRDSHPEWYGRPRQWAGDEVRLDPGMTLSTSVSEYRKAVQRLWPQAIRIREEMKEGASLKSILEK